MRLAAALPAFRKGLTMYIGAVALLAALSCTGVPAIFSRADARPSG